MSAQEGGGEIRTNDHHFIKRGPSRFRLNYLLEIGALDVERENELLHLKSIVTYLNEIKYTCSIHSPYIFLWMDENLINQELFGNTVSR
jgi:hypothetical protein